jgi:hypothetical protein
MNNPIVIVHGWSDDSDSFGPLAAFLRKNLRTSVTTINLADWVSMDDEITYNDLRFAMQRAWTSHANTSRKKNLSIVSHSTGALVVRDWMTHYYNPATVPIKRHLMLAPANFGSQLAHKGRAWYGRVFKGWKHGFQTGKHLLRGLELASPYSWKLAHKDLFGGKRWYGTDRIMAAVLVGDSGYGGVKAVTDEQGGDGTVRVSTANLNAAVLRVDYSKASGRPEYEIKRPPRNSSIAFGICHGDNHGSVAFKDQGRKRVTPRGKHTREWVLKALKTTPQAWRGFVDQLASSNRELYADPDPEDDYFHGFQNTVLRVRDNLDNPVDEYIVEFDRKKRAGRFSSKDFGAVFQRNIITDVHNYQKDESYRSFYINVTALAKVLKAYDLHLKLEALPEYRRGDTVGYEKPVPVTIESSALSGVFEINRTLLVDLRVPRVVHEKAFAMKPYGRS